MIQASFVRLSVLLLSLWLPGSALAQCVSLTTAGSAYTQNFDTLSNTAGSTTNTLAITGWSMTETGGAARDNEQYAVETGASGTGDTYSFGSTGSTERALGSIQSSTLIPTFGACFTNNTGAALTALDISYNGEQWRIGNTAAARDDRLDFQYSLDATSLTTGAWTDVNTLDFTNPVKTAAAAAARDGNDAANRAAISASISSLSIANGATVWIRWNDLNASGADDGLALDDFSLTPQGAGSATPALSINDVSLSEGNAGTVTFSFTVSLSQAAGVGGVSFDIATADNTATSADSDYVARSLSGQTIAAGNNSYSFDVTVNGDTAVEPNETFFVNVTNVAGANVADAQGQGTIVNEDVVLTPINVIQGAGTSSPIVGSSVTTRGIVTGRRTNGFFMQVPDAEVDADPATSEGILVFTSSAPPAGAQVGDLVQVSGTVTEFVPSSDPLQPPLTELTTVTVTNLSSGNPLPVAIALSASFPDPAGAHDQLERVEGMRVAIASLTVGAPTAGFLSESNATSTTSGVFMGVVTGLARAFREPGIQAPDPAPAGSIPPIPRYDSNPEVIRVDSDAIGNTALDVATGAVVTGLVGPLDYTFRRYTLLPELGSTPSASGGLAPTAVTAALDGEVTIATYNLQRFYNTSNDAGSDVVLTAAAFENRLAKASDGIRNHLRSPDILAVVEMENLSTLQTLATRLSTDALANAQPDPQYVAYLTEGNDVGGIDVGFLVKTAVVAAATPRVSVTEVVQELAGTLFVHPDASTELLNDRPPLRLTATVNNAAGQSWPVTVIVNHLRSLNDSASTAAGPNGWSTAGERVRAKRQAQAVDLANLVQARQTANPTEAIVLVGDFNAFEFNDGLGHSLATIAGTPVPDNETAVAGDGADLVNPDLQNLQSTEPASERYSFVFDGNAQSLDHVLVNQPLITGSLSRRLEHARINADFPETTRNVATAQRLADHDPVVLYVAPQALAAVDLSITLADSPDPVLAGNALTYTVTVDNAGPVDAAGSSWTATLPAGTSFSSLSSAAGWNCATPAVGAAGTVTCSLAAFAPGQAVFTLVLTVDPALAAGSTLSTTASVSSSTPDSSPANNSASTGSTVATAADLGVAMLDSPDPVAAGGVLSYAITASNAGPSVAAAVTLSDTLPAGTRFQSLTAPVGFTCTTPAVGATGTVTCSSATMAIGSAAFTLVVEVDGALANGSVLSNTVTLTSTTTDGSPGNNSATTTSTVAVASTDLSITLADSPDPVLAGNPLTYAVTVANSGGIAANDSSWTGTLPAGTTFASLSAAAGWTCTTPAVGAGGAVGCSHPAFAPGSAIFSLVVTVDAGSANGSVLGASVTATSSTSDNTPANNSASTNTTVATAADLGLSLADSPDPVVAGNALTYTLTASNAGPSAAAAVTLTQVLPAGTRFAALVAPAGFSCTTPAIGAAGTVSCSAASVAVGSAGFTLTVTVDAGTAGGSVITANASISSTTTDPNPGNNSATVSTLVEASSDSDLSISITDTPDPVVAGSTLGYVVAVGNAGPAAASAVGFSLPLPAGASFVSASLDGGGSCGVAAATLTCTFDGAFTVGTRSASLQLQVAPSVAGGSTLASTATVSSGSTDPNPGNNAATVSTQVVTSANLAVSLTVSPTTPVFGGTLTFTGSVANAGPSDAQNVQLVVTLPAGLAFISASTSAGTCSNVAVAGATQVTCLWPGATAAGSTRSASIQARYNAPPSGGVGAAASAATGDPAGGNNSVSIVLAGAFSGTAELIPASDVGSLLLMVGLLAIAGSLALRRRG